MRVALLTREYPPDVYGGAGVHVEYLARELAQRVELEVHCWGAEREDPAVHAYEPWAALAGNAPHIAALQAVSIDLLMAAGVEGAEVAHSTRGMRSSPGTWRSCSTGSRTSRPCTRSSRCVRGRPSSSVAATRCRVTARRRRWRGADAVIAVSEGSKHDIMDCYPAIDESRIEVVYNGIDTEEYKPDPRTDVLERFGIDPSRPTVVFVGRITRQKGVPHLVRAALGFDPAAQLVLCAGAPDTPAIGAEVAAGVDRLNASRDGVFWIAEMLPKPDVIQLLSHATVFACPSIYEPLGIVNLEAMACETAVVATATGGIVEVVVDRETGLLVPFEPAPGSIEPIDPDAFAAGIAERVNGLIADPELAQRMGRAGRARAVEHFAWPAIAEQTAAIYERLAVGATERDSGGSDATRQSTGV
jgi:alpha-maltose-1-phosphate synthase